MGDKHIDSSKKNQLLTTETNMYPDMLADDDKLRSEQNRWFWTKEPSKEKIEDDDQFADEFKSFYGNKEDTKRQSESKESVFAKQEHNFNNLNK
jgi:hypothetical protein